MTEHPWLHQPALPSTWAAHFTDVVPDHAGIVTSTKVLTTHDAPERAVIDGTRVILQQAGLSASALTLAIHGTTLAINALIERKGARTALLTTNGRSFPPAADPAAVAAHWAPWH